MLTEGWVSDWVYNANNEPGKVRGFTHRNIPLWMIAGQLLNDIDGGGDQAAALSRLADIMNHGDYIARQKAMAIFECVAPFDPEFVAVCNNWGRGLEAEILEGDIWTSGHFNAMRIYANNILWRLDRLAYKSDENADALEMVMNFDSDETGYQHDGNYGKQLTLNFDEDVLDTFELGIAKSAAPKPEIKKETNKKPFPLSKTEIEKRRALKSSDHPF